MPTYLLRTLAILLVGALLIACGASEPTPTPPPPTPTVAPTEAPTEAPVSEPATPAVAAITVGVNAQFKPFVFSDESGRLAGFDIELMNALAQTGQFELGFVDRPFDELLDAVANGEIDAAISAITITPQRQEKVDFTEPYFGQGQAVAYFSGGQGLAVGADNATITGVDALTADHKVGAKQGTTGADYVQNETAAQLVTFPEAEPALAALAAGEVDAVVLDVPVIVNYIKANAPSGVKLAGPPITQEQYGIAVSKAKPEVLAMLNAGLEQLRTNGAYDAIYQRWFGAP